MKTYLEWHYDDMPPKHELIEAAVELPNGVKEIIPVRFDGQNWYDMLHGGIEIPANWTVYAWAHRYPAIPPVDIDNYAGNPR